MHDQQWQLTIIDAAPPNSDLGSLAAGDIDNDGHVELFVAGTRALSWYRPDTLESGVIDTQHVFQVGITLADLDGDGALELIIGDCDPPQHLFIYKPGARLDQPWRKIVVDATVAGSPHDVIAVDIDNDGQLELVANNIDAHPGLFIYKRAPGAGIDGPWRKHAVQTGFFEEGLIAADIDGDGRVEISSGPNLYCQPADGSLNSPWTQQALAPDFREMCRNAAIDIDGDGVPELVIIESEYMDGRVAWFDHTPSGWARHDLPGRYVFGHSLDARRDAPTGRVTIFIAEMAQGGWNPPYNWGARLLELISNDNGATWRESRVYTGAGTHEAEACDIDNDGEIEYVGKECFRPKVQIYKRRRTPPLAFAHTIIDRDRPTPGTALLLADIDNDGATDIVSGAFCYRAPAWTRTALPGVAQALAVMTGRGVTTVLATAADDASALLALSSADGVTWQRQVIGRHHNAHAAHALDDGFLVADADGVTALRHSGARWSQTRVTGIDAPVRAFALWTAGGERHALAGPFTLTAHGDSFSAARVIAGFDVAALAIGDVDGDGAPEVIAGEYLIDAATNIADPSARLAWFKPNGAAWPMRVIDRLRCPHSVDVFDLDGDGVVEVIAGEHDPSKPFRTRSRLIAWQRMDARGRSWSPTVIDDRFEHFAATRAFIGADGRPAIASQGASDYRYLHIWRRA
jgi:hypothetical protein